MTKGLAERNVAELTLIKKEAEKKRQRHTLASLMTIVDAKMTKHYQDGHTEKGIEHLEVGADLAF